MSWVIQEAKKFSPKSKDLRIASHILFLLPYDLVMRLVSPVPLVSPGASGVPVVIRVEKLQVESFLLLCFKEDMEPNCGSKTELLLLS